MMMPKNPSLPLPTKDEITQALAAFLAPRMEAALKRDVVEALAATLGRELFGPVSEDLAARINTAEFRGLVIQRVAEIQSESRVHKSGDY